MLGRTHMAVGMLGAAALVPVVMHGGIHAELVHHLSLVRLEDVVAVIAGGAVGGLLPDLDHRNSLAARRVEVIGQVVIFATLLYLASFLHLQGLYMAIGAVVSLFSALLCKGELSRKVALFLIAAVCLYLAFIHHMSWLSGILFAAWAIGAFSFDHRTFTHSLLGLVTFGVAAVSTMTAHTEVLAWFLLLGYVLHLVADSISGGIPLLWPFIQERQGVRVVVTGSVMDKMVGFIATLGFLVILIA